MKLIGVLLLLTHCITLISADSLSDWMEAVNKYLDEKIATDPFNVYKDIKGDITYLNSQFTQLIKDINYQMEYTETLLNYVGSEVSNRSAILSSAIEKFPDALHEMNDNFGTIKDGISALPLKPPCHAKVTSTIDSLKDNQMWTLSRTMEYNENNVYVSNNLLRAVGQVQNVAESMASDEIVEGMKLFRNAVVEGMTGVVEQYANDVQQTLMEMDQKMNMINQMPVNQRAAAAQTVKLEMQKKLEMVRAKTMVDLQNQLQFVVHSMSDLQMDAEELTNVYMTLLDGSTRMVNDVDAAYFGGIQGSQLSTEKINRIAGLVVTTKDGTRLKDLDYVPCYTLDEKEQLYSVAQTDRDLLMLITGESEGTPHTRKIYKMYVDENTDWVNMWIFKDGKVVEETMYIYTYNEDEC